MNYREPILNNSSNSIPDPFAEIRFKPTTLYKLSLTLLKFYSPSFYTDTNLKLSLS